MVRAWLYLFDLSFLNLPIKLRQKVRETGKERDREKEAEERQRRDTLVGHHHIEENNQ